MLLAYGLTCHNKVSPSQALRSHRHRWTAGGRAHGVATTRAQGTAIETPPHPLRVATDPLLFWCRGHIRPPCAGHGCSALEASCSSPAFIHGEPPVSVHAAFCGLHAPLSSLVHVWPWSLRPFPLPVDPLCRLIHYPLLPRHISSPPACFCLSTPHAPPSVQRPPCSRHPLRPAWCWLRADCLCALWPLWSMP